MRNITVRLLVSKAERKAWKAASRLSGLTLSEWIRRRVAGEDFIDVPPPRCS